MEIILIFGCGVLAMYLFIGFVINVIIFMWSKMKGMDRFEESWDIIINSLSGFCYYLISGMFFWLPVTIMFLLERQKTEEPCVEEEVEDEIEDEGIYPDASIWRLIRHPYRSYRMWFYQYHK